ncbi:MAG: hypothetical protein ABI321_18410 [Polyangia bacterium]
MRRLALLLLATLVPACQSTSQLVIGILTDLRVPSKLSAARLDASRDGVTIVPELWPIADTTGLDFTLPGSFAYFSTRGGTPVVELSLVGLIGDTEIVTRRAQVQLVAGEQLFYRMTMVQSCLGVHCAEGSTCIEGMCKPESVDAQTLPRYRKALVDTVQCDSGTGFIDTGTCSTGSCATIPITGPACPTDEVCQEGTCYARSAQ